MPVLLPANPRILVVTLRRIGDTLLTTPLIRSLRRAFAGATIDVLLFERTAGILKGNPDINDIIAMPERPAPFASLRLALRLWRRYDLAISTQTGDRPTFFAFAAGKRRGGLVAGDGSIGDAFKRLALNDRTQATDNIHRVDRYPGNAPACCGSAAPALTGVVAVGTSRSCLSQMKLSLL